MAEGVLNKRGRLMYLQLTVPILAYRRMVKHCNRPNISSNRVTVMIQRKGALEWITRLDRAKTGKFDVHRTVFMGGYGRN